MNKEKTIRIYNNKISKLNEHNRLYFQNSNPKISDAEYDKLKNEILNLEQENPYLKTSNKSNIKVGYTPSKNFEKYEHKLPMLSLSNAFDYNDLKTFEKKILNFINFNKKINYCV